MQLTFHIDEKVFGPFDEETLRSIPAGIVKARHCVSPDGGQTILPVGLLPEAAFLLDEPKPSGETLDRLRLERMKDRHRLSWTSSPSALRRALRDYRAWLQREPEQGGIRTPEVFDTVRGEIDRLRRWQTRRARLSVLLLLTIAATLFALHSIPKRLRENSDRFRVAMKNLDEATSLSDLDPNVMLANRKHAEAWRRQFEETARLLARESILRARQETEIEKTLLEFDRLFHLADDGEIAPGVRHRRDELQQEAEAQRSRLRDPTFQRYRDLEEFLEAQEARPGREPYVLDVWIERIQAFRETYPDFEKNPILEARRKLYEEEKKTLVIRSAESEKRALRTDLRENWQAVQRIPASEYEHFIDEVDRFLGLPNPEHWQEDEARRIRTEKLPAWDRDRYATFHASASTPRSDTDLEKARTAGIRYLEICDEYKARGFPAARETAVRNWLDRLEEIRDDGCALTFGISRIEVTGIDVKERGIQIVLRIDERPILSSGWIPRDAKQSQKGMIVFSAIPNELTKEYKVVWDETRTTALRLQVHTDAYGASWNLTGLRNPLYEVAVEDSRFPFIHLATPNDVKLQLKDKNENLNIRVKTVLRGLDFPPLPEP